MGNRRSYRHDNFSNSDYFPQNGILYVIFCLIFVCEPDELKNFGLCAEAIFSKWLGDPRQSYISYHLRRINLTTIFHSSLPIFYGFYLDDDLRAEYWKYACLPCLLAITWVCFYHFGFALGPIESQLLKMKEPGESIIDLLQLINQDMNTGTKFQNRSVTITQNFIISPSTYSFNICRQSVAQLKVVQARELTQQNERTDHARVMNMTYYTILVTAPDVSFRIFVHTDEIDDFKSHLAAQLGSDGTEYESLTTRFLKEANKVIELNAKSERREIENDDSLCAACGAVEPDVRLTSCDCRALFCQECMLRCFMAKQKPEHMSTWLSSTAKCPVCTKPFNLLNISPFSVEDHL